MPHSRYRIIAHAKHLYNAKDYAKDIMLIAKNLCRHSVK